MKSLFQWGMALICAVTVWHYWLHPTSTVIQQSSSRYGPVYTAESRRHHYHVQPLSDYSGRFRILNIKKYRLGREAELSPSDFVLAWGAMAQPYNYLQIKISQNNRWVYWRANHLPIPQPEMEASMANTHMIPANQQIAKQLSKLKKQDLVWLGGHLVEIKAADGWIWRSSLSRTDSGAGACEVFLVKEVRLLERPSLLDEVKQVENNTLGWF